MAMSLRDRSDTWANATAFIHASNAHLQGPGRVTACGWSPHRTPGQVRLVLHRGAPPSSQVIQAENARSLGGRATTWQDLSYLGERSSGKERRMQDRVL
jgi:hypothetical protein